MAGKGSPVDEGTFTSYKPRLRNANLSGTIEADPRLWR